jgi:hypothetical protein
MSTTSSQTFYTANSSPSCSSAGQTVNTDSAALSNNSYHYSVNSVNSYKSRKNVLYPCRVHPLPECACIASPDPEVHFLSGFIRHSSQVQLLLYPAQMLAREVRHLCADLLPHSETRLLPAGIVLLRSLGKETDLSSQHKNDETRYCSELFIMLAREIILKDAVGVEELEGPCRILHLYAST